MSVWSNIRGTIETIFQIGLGGPQLKNNAGAIEARNAGDSAMAVVRGAPPVGDSDLVTKAYADTLASRTIVSAQFDGNNPLPANTATEHFSIVTTSGPNATIGQIVWDDGTGVGTATVLVAVDGRLVVTTQAFSGGTITLAAESIYVWDAGTTAWLNAGGSSMSAAIRLIRYPLTTAATQDSAQQIPPNAFVLRARLEVVTPYSGGTTIAVGQPGNLTLLLATADNLATAAGTYEIAQDTAWGAAPLAVRTTVAGAPAVGAGFVLVEYSVPDL